MSDSASPTDQNWKDVYRAAIFEDDASKIPQRITAAYAAIDARRQQLWAAGDDIRERQAMDNAMFCLRALSACLTNAHMASTGNTPRRSARAI